MKAEKQLSVKNRQGVVVHAFSHSIPEAKAVGSLSWRPAWST